MFECKKSILKVKFGDPEHHIYIPVTICDKEIKLHFIVDEDNRLIKVEDNKEEK